MSYWDTTGIPFSTTCRWVVRLAVWFFLPRCGPLGQGRTNQMSCSHTQHVCWFLTNIYFINVIHPPPCRWPWPVCGLLPPLIWVSSRCSVKDILVSDPKLESASADTTFLSVICRSDSLEVPLGCGEDVPCQVFVFVREPVIPSPEVNQCLTLISLL